MLSGQNAYYTQMARSNGCKSSHFQNAILLQKDLDALSARSVQNKKPTNIGKC